MPSIAESIAARGEVIAQGLGSLLVGVFRDREDAFSREESPVLLIELVDEDSTPLGGPVGPFAPIGVKESSVLRIAFIVCVRGAGWQAVADSVRVPLHAALLADAELRTLTHSIVRDRCEWKAASADQPFGYCAQIYQFKTLTRATALDSLAT